MPPHFTRALTRTPAKTLADGLTTQHLGKPDHALVMEQYAGYLDALHQCGLEVVTLPADDAFPDSCFIEDTAILYRDLVVITQPGAPSRRGETAAVEAALRRLCPDKAFVCIDGEARLDGGDVLMCADRVLIGLSARTNCEGAEQLQQALQSYESSLKVDCLPFTGVLHLKSGLTELAPGVLLLSPQLKTDYRFVFAEVVQLPLAESYAADVLPINDAVIIPAGYPTVLHHAQRHYTHIFELTMSEFQKMDGGLTCLSLLF